MRIEIKSFWTFKVECVLLTLPECLHLCCSSDQVEVLSDRLLERGVDLASEAKIEHVGEMFPSLTHSHSHTHS
jgi:hypothetical protein